MWNEKSNYQRFLPFVLFTWALLLYLNILHAPFFFDDHTLFTHKDLLSFGGLKDLRNNRYITILSFALNYTFGGTDTFVYHLINILIHCLNGILVFYLVELTFSTPYFRAPSLRRRADRWFVSGLSALLFISHPIQTESVTYIVQRATSLSTFFYLFSLVMYIKSRLVTVNEGDSPISSAGRAYTEKGPVSFYYLLSLLSALFAMKSKEIAFTLPVMIGIYEFTFFRAVPVRTRIRYLVPLILTGLVIPMSLYLQKGYRLTDISALGSVVRETTRISRIDYLITQIRVIVTYLRLLVLPVNQSVDHNYPVYHSLLAPGVTLSLLLLAVIVFGVVFLYRHGLKKPSLLILPAFGMTWFFVALSVESSFIPIRDVMFEHRLYLPSVGFFLSLSVLMAHFIRQRRSLVGLSVVIVLVFSMATVKRNQLWNDPEALWMDTIMKSHDNPRAYINLAVYLNRDGRHKEALEIFKRVLSLDRKYETLIHYDIGDTYFRMEDYRSAAAYFKKILGRLKRYPVKMQVDVYHKLGMCYAMLGEHEKAVKVFGPALQKFPDEVQFYNNIGVEYIKLKDYEKAIRALEKGISINPLPQLLKNLEVAKRRSVQ